MKKLKVLFVALALAIVPATAVLAQASEGQVIVVHGVPDLDVDIAGMALLALGGGAAALAKRES